MTQTAYDVEPGRQIKHVTIPAGEARAAVYTRTFAAGIDDVWDACTNPERLRRWFLALEGDLRQGGRYELIGVVTGTVLRCEAPRLVSVSWEYQDFPVDQVELRLTQLDDEHTRLELEHATVKRTEEWDGKVLDSLVNMSSGWEPGLAALDLELSGDLPADNTLASFRQSPEAAAVIARAKKAWAELAAGDERG